MVTLTLLNPLTKQPLESWNFPHQSTIRIGRMPENDVVLPDYLQVSRHHLELRQIGFEEWRLVNQGTNGTFLNGFLVSQGIVRDNSLIQLAKDGPMFRFEMQTSTEIQTKTPPSLANCDHAGNSANNLFCIHCGLPIVAQEKFVRQYQILRTLGRGGMGTTYLAWDRSATSNKVPLLLVLKEMNADMVQIAKARELFEREARVLKSLHHRGIPKYYDFFVENNQKYLAMELIHGENLEQAIYQKGPVTAEKAIAWTIQVCDILKYLHGLDPPLVHRDVKPANLMMRTLDRGLVLLDFGAVKEIGTPLGTRIGAEGYSAPEQNRGKPCPQSDIYGVGATLIFLVTSKAPMEYYRIRGNSYNFDLSAIPTITPALKKVIEKACESNVSERYSSAEELATALIGCVGNS